MGDCVVQTVPLRLDARLEQFDFVRPAESQFQAGRVYLPPGHAFALTAATPNGVALKTRFAWADPVTGQVGNVYVDATQPLGIALVEPERLLRNGWLIATFDDCLWTLRAGVGCSLAIQGDFWMPVASGASPGDPIYASQADGTATAIPGAGFVVTPWRAMSYASPGNRALISSWYRPFGG